MGLLNISQSKDHNSPELSEGAKERPRMVFSSRSHTLSLCSEQKNASFQPRLTNWKLFDLMIDAGFRPGRRPPGARGR